MGAIFFDFSAPPLKWLRRPCHPIQGHNFYVTGVRGFYFVENMNGDLHYKRIISIQIP